MARPLEHFRAKWTPVRVKKMRPNKGLERFRDSVKFGNALECFQEKWIPVFRPETRQNNTLGSGFDSIKTGRTLEGRGPLGLVKAAQSYYE